MSKSNSCRFNLGSLAAKLDGRVGRCAALAAAGAGAGGAMLAAPQSADAAIVYSGAVNINIPATTAGVYLNVVTTVNNVAPALAPGWDVNPFSSSGLSFFNPSAPSGGVYVLRTGGTNVGNLPAGTLIGAVPGGGRTYGSGSGITTGADPFVLNSSNNCVGFRFQNEANGNATHYGWMQISLSGTLTSARAIVGYAYDDVAGTAIGCGNTPEPASIGLLAMGAAGLMLRRRK